MDRLCACGRVLHYQDPAQQAYVQRSVHAYGPLVAFATRLGTWLVPRHFVALHGIEASALPALAALYRWKCRGVEC